MFESVQKDDRAASITCFSTLAVSIIAHTIIVTSLVIVPMFIIKGGIPDGLITIVLPRPVLETPILDKPPVAASSPATGQKGGSTRVFKTEIPTNVITQPVVIPTGIPVPSDEEFVWSTLDMPGGIGGGDGSGIPGIGAGDILGTFQTAGYSPAAKQPVKLERKTVPIGSLDPSRLLRRVSPVYPELALRTNVQGTVKLEALIDEEGNMVDIKVIEGHPLLYPAAVDAVKQWKYTPTIQNGEPIRVLASIQIVFKID